MSRRRGAILPRAVWLLALALAPGAALADITNESRQVAGMTFYLGIVPAEIVQGHPPGHPERDMHKGARSGRSKYHVVVAIFDAKTGDRIDDAEVRARVESVGVMSGQEKALEPMPIANAMTYGGFFDMAGTGTFRINLQVRRRGEPGPVEVRFEHAHR